MVSSRYARHPQGTRRARIEDLSQCKTHQAIDAPLQFGESPMDGRRDKSSSRGEIHQGNKRGHMVVTTSHGGKKDTKIYRMCIDFTALNKHCPKDYFPLPRIDQIIDSTAGCERLLFLNA
jgi:hypothetical protein